MNCIFRPLEKESLWALKAPFGEYLSGETCVSAVALWASTKTFHELLSAVIYATCPLAAVMSRCFPVARWGYFHFHLLPARRAVCRAVALFQRQARVVVAETPLAQYSRSNCVHPYLNVSIRACKTSISKQCLVWLTACRAASAHFEPLCSLWLSEDFKLNSIMLI